MAKFKFVILFKSLNNVENKFIQQRQIHLSKEMDLKRLMQILVASGYLYTCQDTPNALKQLEDFPCIDEYQRLQEVVEYDKAKPDAGNWFDRAQLPRCDAFAIFKALADINETLDGLYEFAFACGLACGTGPEEIKIALAMRIRYANVARQ